MTTVPPRFARERDTIAAMIGIYCREQHGGRRELCDECGAVLAYAGQRLDKCLFPDSKPTCATCPVHCYKPEMRERVKQIMRFAGPRMIYHHPYLALRHILDGHNRRPPVRRKRDGGAPAGEAAVDSAEVDDGTSSPGDSNPA